MNHEETCQKIHQLVREDMNWWIKQTVEGMRTPGCSIYESDLTWQERDEIREDLRVVRLAVRIVAETVPRPGELAQVYINRLKAAAMDEHQNNAIAFRFSSAEQLLEE